MPRRSPQPAAVAVRLDHVDRPEAIVKATGGYVLPRVRLKALLTDLGDRDASVRADAAYELGFTGAAEAVPALCAAVADPDAKVVRAASRAVEAIAGAGACSPDPPADRLE